MLRAVRRETSVAFYRQRKLVLLWCTRDLRGSTNKELDNLHQGPFASNGTLPSHNAEYRGR